MILAATMPGLDAEWLLTPGDMQELHEILREGVLLMRSTEDPRVLPDGRMINGVMRRSPEGAYVLDAEYEEYEAYADPEASVPDPKGPFFLPDRMEPGVWKVSGNTLLNNPEDREMLCSLDELLECEEQAMVLRDIEGERFPIFKIHAGVCLGSIRQEIMTRLKKGRLLYPPMLHLMYSLAARREEDLEQRLMVLDLTVYDAECTRSLNVIVVLADGSKREMLEMIGKVGVVLDNSLPPFFAEKAVQPLIGEKTMSPLIGEKLNYALPAQLVISFLNGKLDLQYGVSCQGLLLSFFPQKRK